MTLKRRLTCKGSWRKGFTDMATQPIITKDVITKTISLLDWCYRLGVRQARELNDEGAAREFLDTHNEVGVYGFLSDGLNVGVLEWQLRLQKEARLTSMFGSMYQYFLRMGRFSANYLSCFLPIAQMWHNLGVQDYIDNPHACDWAVFDSKTRVRWSKKGLLNIKAKEYVEMVQLQCFDLQRKHAAYLTEHADDYKARKVAIKEQHWTWYIRAVGLALTSNKE